MEKSSIGVLLLMVVIVAIWGCAHKSHPPAASTIPAAAMMPPGCGALLAQQLAHVYHPDRLHVKEQRKVVTSMIDLVRSEKDSDYHVRLRLDPSQGQLTNARNDEQAGSSSTPSASTR